MKVIEHHLAVCPHARSFKQKVRKQALEWKEFIAKEIRKLEVAGLVRGVIHPTWLANPVVMCKANGKWQLCIDFTDVNKACPKDPFPCRASIRLSTPLLATTVFPSSTPTQGTTKSLWLRRMKRKPDSSPPVACTALCECPSD